MKPTPPPKLLLRFFRWYCHPRLADHIEGDLLEVYLKRQLNKGKRIANFRLMIDVLLLVRPGIIKSFNSYHTTNQSGMIKNYFLIGWRNITRSKGYSAINIGGLAVGIAVTMLISLWIHDELSFDQTNDNYPRIGRVIQHVTNNDEKQTWFSVPFPLAEELRKNYGSDFKHIAMAAQWGDHLLSFEDKKLKVTGVYFEQEATQIFNLKMIAGSSKLSEPASILLSSSMAKAYFGDEEALNKLMKIDDKPIVKVTGVYEDFPHNSTFASLNFISPWELYYGDGEWAKTMEDTWRPNFTMLFVELNDNADFASASARIKDAKLKRINAQLAKKKPELFLLPMSDWHLRSEFKNGINTGGAIQYVWMFGIIGSFVLLLACINFMNLSTARSERRAKEVGVRKTIGSRSSQLTQQFFSESFLTVFIAFVLSLLIVQLSLPLFNEVSQKQMSIAWLNPIYWLVCISLIIITALVAGSYPAFYLSSFKPINVLKGTFKAGRFASVPRKILVVIQFTMSVILIIGTIIVYQQIQYTKDRPVGYTRQHLITIPTMNSSIHDHFDAIKNELLQAGVIISMAESESPTTGIWNSTSGFSWNGKDPDLSVDFGVITASHDYGQTIAWQIKEGRGFSRDFVSDSSAVLLNETAAQYMGLKNPVGETITWWGQPVTVIGIINDMVVESPYAQPRPVIYGLLNYTGNVVIIKLNHEVSSQESLAKVESVFKKYNTEQPFEFQFVDADYAKKFGDEERIEKLAGFFTMLAVLISCMGIFGLASFTAEQRAKEIGIRKVLGASVTTLWKMLAQEFVLLVGFACLIAIPFSYYFVDQWLSKYAYRIGISWSVFVIVGMSTLVLTVITISYQAITTAIANPVKSLRSE